MGRAPCCEKMGLKKGPWTAEEDQTLTNYINLYGHGNWRALPKQAGLLRCGKSCRLRWTNYLRPDIKRGNFSKEEEETIIKLHESMGNRWSAIAARLPGRTDNEIKNVWHTHLKKKLKTQQKQNNMTETESVMIQEQEHDVTNSPMWSSSQNGSSGSPELVPEMEDKFWSEGGFLSEFQVSSVGGGEGEGMEFWYELFATASAGELTELTEFPEI